MNRIKKYKYVIIAPIVLAVVVFGLRIATKNDNAIIDEKNTKTVSLINIGELLGAEHLTQSVGQIDSKQSVDMKAQVNGTIKSVNAQIGGRVYTGQVIASFTNADSYANLAQAEAGVKIQEARLSEITGGSRSEELNVSELAVKNAESGLDATRSSVVETVRSAYIGTNDVIYNKIDPMFSNPRTNPKLTFNTNNFEIENRIKINRMLIEDMMKSWSSDVNALTKTGNLNNAISVAKENLATIASFLDDMATIVNALDENTTLSAATISTYKASVSASRSTISGHISGLSSAQSALSSSITGYEQAKQQLSIKESGGTSDQVRAQQALLDQAKANLLAAQAQYAKTIITSPINGEIASLPIKVGQYVGVNQTVVKVINKNNLHIKSFINTDDIPFVKAGDTVLVENIGEGIVTVVSPGIDPSNGKVEVEISIPEEKEKAVIEGEYVHVTIQSKRDPLAVSNTILLPIKAVKVSSKGAFVYIVENNIVLEKQIEVGNVLGTEVEVVSGLTQYDSVVSTTRGVNVNDKVTIE